MDGPSQPPYGPSVDATRTSGNPPHAMAHAYAPLDVRGHGANHPPPTQPRASQSEGLVVHAALDVTGPLSVGGKGLSPMKKVPDGSYRHPADDHNVAHPTVQGRGLLSPIQGISLSPGHRAPDVVGPAPVAENIEWESPAAHPHRSGVGRSPKPAVYGEGPRTTPDGVLRGTELHFAMNRPDNQAVLKLSLIHI
eukprot:TRINITY_DN11257_c0_g1_i2.p1 TRINITY_DN11257_c0_g1~~TRINITY_DN11257_c0_g1_i2.p1  ORF type:complete len:194 (-),score=6.55 TRINITY_DN11257_c0_g1_i2:197-778(-)